MTLDKVRYSLPPLQRQPSWCNWCKPGMLLSNHYNYTQQPIFRIGWYHITWTWRDTDNGESLNTSFRPEKDERLVHHVILSYPSARWYAHMSLRWGGPNEAHLLIQLDRLFNGWKATQLWISRFVTLRQEWIILDIRTVMDTHSISYAPDHRNAELLPALVQQNCVMEIWPFNCPLWNLQRCGNRLTRPYRWCGRQARLPFVSIAMSYQETIKVANEMMPTVVSSCAMISLYLKQTVWRGREAVLVRLSFKAKPAQTPTNLVTGWFRVSINSSSTAITCLSKTRQPLLSRIYQHNS